MKELNPVCASECCLRNELLASWLLQPDGASVDRACQERLSREVQTAVTAILCFNKAFRNQVFLIYKTVKNSHWKIWLHMKHM